MAALICSKVGKRHLSAVWSHPNPGTCFHERQETILLGPTFAPVRLAQNAICFGEWEQGEHREE